MNSVRSKFDEKCLQVNAGDGGSRSKFEGISPVRNTISNLIILILVEPVTPKKKHTTKSQQTSLFVNIICPHLLISDRQAISTTTRVVAIQPLIKIMHVMVSQMTPIPSNELKIGAIGGPQRLIHVDRKTV